MKSYMDALDPSVIAYLNQKGINKKWRLSQYRNQLNLISYKQLSGYDSNTNHAERTWWIGVCDHVFLSRLMAEWEKPIANPVSEM